MTAKERHFDQINFCHRRMVAGWLERELSEEILEL